MKKLLICLLICRFIVLFASSLMFFLFVFLDFLSTLCEGYYTFSPHVVSNMCGFEERMTERKQAVSFPDDFSSYSSPYFQQPVPESPRTGEIPPQSPSHLSDSGRVSRFCLLKTNVLDFPNISIYATDRNEGVILIYLFNDALNTSTVA